MFVGVGKFADAIVNAVAGCRQLLAKANTADDWGSGPPNACPTMTMLPTNSTMPSRVESPTSFHILGAAPIRSTIIATGSAHRCARSIGPAVRAASAGQRVRIAIPAINGANTEIVISSAIAQGLAMYWCPKTRPSNGAATAITGTARTASTMTRPSPY